MDAKVKLAGLKTSKMIDLSHFPQSVAILLYQLPQPEHERHGAGEGEARGQDGIHQGGWGKNLFESNLQVNYKLFTVSL